MPTTRNVTIETDSRSYPITLMRPMDLREIADYVRTTILEPEGQYGVFPSVSMESSGSVARVHIVPIVDSVRSILAAL